jgi:hypothetical protein
LSLLDEVTDGWPLVGSFKVGAGHLKDEGWLEGWNCQLKGKGMITIGQWFHQSYLHNVASINLQSIASESFSSPDFGEVPRGECTCSRKGSSASCPTSPHLWVSLFVSFVTTFIINQ